MTKSRISPAEPADVADDAEPPIDPESAEEGAALMYTAMRSDGWVTRAKEWIYRQENTFLHWFFRAWCVLLIGGMIPHYYDVRIIAMMLSLLELNNMYQIIIMLPRWFRLSGFLVVVTATTWVISAGIALVMIGVGEGIHINPTGGSGIRLITVVGDDGTASCVIESAEDTPHELVHQAIEIGYDDACQITPLPDEWQPSIPSVGEQDEDQERIIVTGRVVFKEQSAHDCLLPGHSVAGLADKTVDVSLLPDAFVELVQAKDLSGVLVVDLSPRVNQASLCDAMRDEARTQRVERRGTSPGQSADRGIRLEAGAEARDEALDRLDADQVTDISLTVAIVAPPAQEPVATATLDELATIVARLTSKYVDVNIQQGSTAGSFLQRRRARTHRDAIRSGTPGAEYTPPKRFWNNAIRQSRKNYPADPSELPLFVYPSRDDFGHAPTPSEYVPPVSQIDDLSDLIGVDTPDDEPAFTNPGFDNSNS